MNRRLAGFSLVEMLIALAISSVIGVLLISIFIQNNSISRDQVMKTSQSLSNNTAYSKIGSDIRQASAIAVSYNAPPVYTTDSDTLVLQIPSTDNNGGIIANTYDYIVITPDASKSYVLREMVFPNAASSRKSANTVLTASLKKVIFYYLDTNQNPVTPATANAVNFVINQTSATGNQTEQSSVSGQINLRNN